LQGFFTKIFQFFQIFLEISSNIGRKVQVPSKEELTEKAGGVESLKQGFLGQKGR
jgi:hypothetical protein